MDLRRLSQDLLGRCVILVTKSKRGPWQPNRDCLPSPQDLDVLFRCGHQVIGLDGAQLHGQPGAAKASKLISVDFKPIS